MKRKCSNVSRKTDKVENASVMTTFIEEIGTDFKFKHQIVWKNLFGLLVFHSVGLLGLYNFFTFRVKFITFIYTFLLGQLTGLGISMAAHAYFTHRSFKAKPLLERFLLLLFVLSGQNSLWEWVRDHRQHHKYSDTDADPHNARRGFFFSHIGWLMSRKHPKVIEYGKKIDMSDIERDTWIMFQKKYLISIYIVVAIFIPCIIPVLLWTEDPIKSILVCYFARTVAALNITWSINSFAHFYGTRPYDKNILPVQNNFVNVIALGSGGHNYHHTFPWDYRSSESVDSYNPTAKIIEYGAKMGWIYDLKTASKENIKNRVLRTGDNSQDYCF